MIRYLNHLLCMKRSLIDGILCRDGYYPNINLNTDKDDITIEDIRMIIVTEHNKRRVNRGLGRLTQSITLNIIAQKYAEKLCEVDRIDHELNGSTLSQRYDEE